ncbi:MAG: hypothetical protein Q9226_001932 [Calogaya cf. arnoldii]
MAFPTPLRRILPKRACNQTSVFPEKSDAAIDADKAEESVAEDVTSLSKKTKLTTTATAKHINNTKQLPNNKIFPFTSLPAELKNKIYEYALVTEYEIPLRYKRRHMQWTNRHTVALRDNKYFQAPCRIPNAGLGEYFVIDDTLWPRVTKPPSLASNLLVLNHETHAQTQPILYSANVFALEDNKALLYFCSTIGPKNCATLRELYIKSWCFATHERTTNRSAFALLANAVDLKYLNIDYRIYRIYKPSFDWARTACEFFQDAQPWLEAVGASKDRRDAAVDIVYLGTDTLHIGHTVDGMATNVLKLDNMTMILRAELRKLLNPH